MMTRPIQSPFRHPVPATAGTLAHSPHPSAPPAGPGDPARGSAGSGRRAPLCAILAAALWTALSLALPAAFAPPALAAAGTGKLTLERIYSDPRLEGVPPRDIRWSPAAPVVAYLWSEQGTRSRNLWVHDTRDGSTRRLTSVSEAPGAEKAEDEETAERRQTMRLEESGVDVYQWTPDGSAIVYGLEGDLWSVGLAGGAPRRLTRTPSPEFDPQVSPDGTRIAFVRDGDLHVMGLDGSGEVQVTTGGSDAILNGLSDYISLEEINRFSAYRWSADGRSLVYIQSDTRPVRELEIPDYLTHYVTHHLQRRPPAGEANAISRVGVVPSTGGETRWVPLHEGVKDFYIPILDRVGDRIAVMQEDRSLQHAWLFLLDPSTASVRPVLEETDDAWINLDRLFIARDDSGRFVYGAERGEHAHLYRLDAKSGSLEPLTSGDWEVTDLDRVGGGQAWFTSTAEGPQERHFYRVALEGGEPVRLTTQPGWNDCRASFEGSWIACLHSDITEPVDLWVERPGSGKPPERITRSPAKDFNPTLLAVPEIITLKSRLDGAPITAALYRPDPGAPPDDLSRGLRPHPALVHVHGGGYAQAVRRGWGGWMTFINALFVEQGYYVLDVDYRGSSGYGRKWRTDVRVNLGGPDLEDTLTAAEYLRSLPDVDPGRVGVWGWSYGGFLTCMSMMAKPGVFNAGVAIAPVTDWAAYDTHYTEERLGLPSEHAEAYRKGSPLTYAARLRDPFLLVHGLRDDNVHVQDSIRLVDELVRDGKDFDVMFYPEAKHGIRRDASRIHLFRKVFAFFLEKMPPRR